jgi:hypothetical protein
MTQYVLQSVPRTPIYIGNHYLQYYLHRKILFPIYLGNYYLDKIVRDIGHREILLGIEEAALEEDPWERCHLLLLTTRHV